MSQIPRTPNSSPTSSPGGVGHPISDSERDLGALYGQFAEEVFVNLVRAHRSPTEMRDATAYLFAAMRHAAFRVVKRRTAAMPLPESAAAPAPFRAGERGDELDLALARLPPEQRQIIALKIDDELTFSQIAAVLQISPCSLQFPHEHPQVLGQGVRGRGRALALVP